MKKSLTAKNKELRDMVKVLQDELSYVESDREKYRNHFKSRLKLYIKLFGEGTTPDMSVLVENEARFWNSVTPFWWG